MFVFPVLCLKALDALDVTWVRQTTPAVCQVPGLKSEHQSGVVLSIEVIESVRALPFDPLNETFEDATSDEFRTM